MIPVYCPLCCDQPFEDQDGLFHHLRSLRNNLFCPICSERFSSFDILISHLSRKCYGPVSPHEAKRKCLLNNSILPDKIAVTADVSSSDLGSHELDVIPNESSPKTPLETSNSTVICNSAEAVNPKPSVIPPEVRKRLPRDVTVSFSPLENVSHNQNGVPAVFVGDKKNVDTHLSTKSTDNNNSRNAILNKLSSNPSLELSVNKGKGISTSEKSALSHTTNSPSVNKLTNDSQNLSTFKPSGKPGPLSSKGKVRNLTRRSMEITQTKDLLGDTEKDHSPSKERQNLNSKPGNSMTKETNLSQELNLSLQDKGSKTAKTGRHRKPPLVHGNKSPMINGVMNQEKSIVEPPVNVASGTSKQCKSDLNTVDESSNNRSMRTRGKKIKICSELLNSDDSNHFEDDASYGRNEDDEQQGAVSSLKEKDQSSKTKTQKPNKEQDKIEKENSNTEPEKISEVVCKTEVGADPKDSSSKDEPKTEEEEEYTCSACNVRFTSIYEHIKQNHNGDEVIVEVPEEEIKEDLKAYRGTSDCKVSIGETEFVNTLAIKADETPDPDKDKRCVQTSTDAISKKEDKRKKDISGFATEGASNDLVYTRTFKKVKKGTKEHWMQLQSEKKVLYQFVRDEDKYKRLITELKNNTSIYPELNMPVKALFETPKINVVEITYQPNSPHITYHRTVDFKNPMPMFVVDRIATNNPDMLGGIASYIMAGKDSDSTTSVGEESKVIGVMKVILASDRELTVENIVFNDKPANPDMVPVLEEVKNPDIPLLKDAKILKWRCNKCLGVTWKFPLHKETHFCNACPICFKTFISPVSLKKHLVLHKRDGTKYCKDCRAAFVSKITLNNHLAVHITHVICDKCHLFVPREMEEEHAGIHNKDPLEQFPCSVCKKVFGSGKDLKSHETKLCSKLVARFNCSLCDKKFFSLTALSYHTAAHNNASIKFHCRFCSKTFIQEKEQNPKKAGKRKPSSFIQKMWHERIHTRDRPYTCNSCPKRFRSLEQESLHSAKHCTTTVPRKDVGILMCTFCDKVFRTEKQLNNHMEQHTKAPSERPVWVPKEHW